MTLRFPIDTPVPDTFPMAKAKTVFICQSCGSEAPKWAGRCADCGDWNSLREERSAGAIKAPARAVGYSGESKVQLLGDVAPGEAPRLSSGISELDRVLGGGLVPGAVILLGGDPGIGKSTLLLQALALAGPDRSLYITGEESLEQVHLRACRLSLKAEGLKVLAETCVERIISLAEQSGASLVVVDSVQTVFTETLDSAPGSVTQLRDSAAALVRFAKQSGTTVLLVGHVTKEGVIAGPRVLEHMVDTVLYFESDRGSRFRLLRAVKNRFGAVNELGVFAMTDGGLKEVANPSAIFLSGHEGPVSGSVVMVTREGSRPMLIEVQALVDSSPLGNPRRVSTGPDNNRLAMLLAVMHRHGGVVMQDQDVFVNIVGGMRVTETAADLPVLMAAHSSLRDRPLPRDLVVFGEIGLAGEIRPVQAGEERLRAAAQQGFKRAIVPQANQPKRGIAGMQITAVRRLTEALEAI